MVTSPANSSLPPLYPRFRERYDEIFSKIDLGVIHPQYHDLETQYCRFIKTVHDLSRSPDLRYGIDFGCGACFPAVLGKMLGIEIVGVDVPYHYHFKKASPYHDLQALLQREGFRIEIFDTTAPRRWEQFRDDEFDFIICYWSLLLDFTTLDEGERPTVIFRRIDELTRILRPGGSWFVAGGFPPKYHHGWLAEELARRGDPKNINLCYMLGAERECLNSPHD